MGPPPQMQLLCELMGPLYVYQLESPSLDQYRAGALDIRLLGVNPPAPLVLAFPTSHHRIFPHPPHAMGPHHTSWKHFQTPTNIERVRSISGFWWSTPPPRSFSCSPPPTTAFPASTSQHGFPPRIQETVSDPNQY